MKKITLFLTALVATILSCSDNDAIEPLTFNEKVAALLNSEGQQATVTEDDRVIILGVDNSTGLIRKLNEIYDKLGKPEYKFDLTSEAENARASQVTCSQSEIYHIEEGVACANYLCKGTDGDLASIADYSHNGVNYTLSTTCVDV